MILPLRKEEIQRHLNSVESPIYIYDEIGSTNQRARELLQEGTPHGTMVLAEKQTAGRGRHGHSFFSPQSGLYYTLIIHPKDENTALAKTTVAAAVSLREAVQQTAGIECGIKWVNDLYLDGKKIAGILCEAPRDRDGRLLGIVIGIGVNVSQEEFPEEIRDTAGSLQRPDLDRNVLAAVLSERLLYWCERLNSSELMEKYKEYSFLLGRKVSFVIDGVCHTGTAEDINTDGNLVVRAEKEYVLSSGEISLESWQS